MKVGWNCGGCGVSGCKNYARSPGIDEIVEAIVTKHEVMSPGCTGVPDVVIPKEGWR